MITKTSWLPRTFAYERESGKFGISMKFCAVIEMFSTSRSRFHRKMWIKSGRHSFNFNRAKVFNRTSYENPKPKLFFEKQIERKRGFLILAFTTFTQKTSQQDFSVIPKSKLEVLRPHITLKFSNFKSWVSLSRYRYNCKQYMRRMEYMHYLRTQSRFKLCMQLADSVQFVIDVLVREKMLPYLCLWPSYVNFYRKEKSTFWGYQIKNMAP